MEGAREHKLPNYYIRDYIQNVPVEDTTGSCFSKPREQVRNFQA